MPPDDFFKNKTEKQQYILQTVFGMFRLGFSEDIIRSTFGMRADTFVDLKESYRMALSTIDYEIDLESEKIKAVLAVGVILANLNGQHTFNP